MPPVNSVSQSSKASRCVGFNSAKAMPMPRPKLGIDDRADGLKLGLALANRDADLRSDGKRSHGVHETTAGAQIGGASGKARSRAQLDDFRGGGDDMTVRTAALGIFHGRGLGVARRCQTVFWSHAHTWFLILRRPARAGTEFRRRGRQAAGGLLTLSPPCGGSDKGNPRGACSKSNRDVGGAVQRFRRKPGRSEIKAGTARPHRMYRPIVPPAEPLRPGIAGARKHCRRTGK